MDYSKTVLRIAVAQICQTVGYHAVQTTPLEILTDVMYRYLMEIGKVSHQYAEQFGRTDVNLDDLALGFRDMGVSISDLEDYTSSVESVAFPCEVPKYPVPRETHLNFLKPGSKEVLTRPVYVHEHLPPMYPDMEDDDTRPSVSCSPPHSSPSNSTFKRPNDPVTETYSAKKPKLSHDEEGRPMREISSVMMTTSGFISPAREGKLPEAKAPSLSPPRSASPESSYAMASTSQEVRPKKSLPFKKIVEGVKKIKTEKPRGNAEEREKPKAPERFPKDKQVSDILSYLYKPKKEIPDKPRVEKPKSERKNDKVKPDKIKIEKPEKRPEKESKSAPELKSHSDGFEKRKPSPGPRESLKVESDDDGSVKKLSPDTKETSKLKIFNKSNFLRTVAAASAPKPPKLKKSPGRPKKHSPKDGKTKVKERSPTRKMSPTRKSSPIRKLSPSRKPSPTRKLSPTRKPSPARAKPSKREKSVEKDVKLKEENVVKGKINSEPDNRQKLNIFKKMATKMKDSGGSRESSPPLVIDENTNKDKEARLARLDDTIDAVIRQGIIESTKDEIVISPPGTPTTPRTPEMPSPVFKETSKHKSKSKFKQEPLEIDVEGPPKTPEPEVTERREEDSRRDLSPRFPIFPNHPSFIPIQQTFGGPPAFSCGFSPGVSYNPYPSFMRHPKPQFPYTGHESPPQPLENIKEEAPEEDEAIPIEQPATPTPHTPSPTAPSSPVYQSPVRTPEPVEEPIEVKIKKEKKEKDKIRKKPKKLKEKRVKNGDKDSQGARRKKDKKKDRERTKEAEQCGEGEVKNEVVKEGIYPRIKFKFSGTPEVSPAPPEPIVNPKIVIKVKPPKEEVVEDRKEEAAHDMVIDDTKSARPPKSKKALMKDEATDMEEMSKLSSIPIAAKQSRRKSSKPEKREIPPPPPEPPSPPPPEQEAEPLTPQKPARGRPRLLGPGPVKGRKLTPVPKAQKKSEDSSSLITETVGSYIDESGKKIWICPACGRQDDGSLMIGCDGCDDWYHCVCVNIRDPPDEDENWYCSRCIAKNQSLVAQLEKQKKRKKPKKP